MQRNCSLFCIFFFFQFLLFFPFLSFLFLFIFFSFISSFLLHFFYKIVGSFHSFFKSTSNLLVLIIFILVFHSLSLSKFNTFFFLIFIFHLSINLFFSLYTPLVLFLFNSLFPLHSPIIIFNIFVFHIFTSFWMPPFFSSRQILHLFYPFIFLSCILLFNFVKHKCSFLFFFLIFQGFFLISSFSVYLLIVYFSFYDF